MKGLELTLSTNIRLGDRYKEFAHKYGGSAESLPYVRGAEYNSKDREDLTMCYPGTRVDLLDKIYEWGEEVEGKPIFWLNGMAGTGKSTIARTVAEELSNRKCLAASFFFARGRGNLGSTAQLCMTLAYQFISRIPGYSRRLATILQRNYKTTEKSLRDQWELLVSRPFLGFNEYGIPRLPGLHRPFVVVIDALDECDREDDAITVIELFAKLGKSSAIPIKLFVTSRLQLVPLCESYSSSPDINLAVQRFSLHNIDRSTGLRDVAIFLENKLQAIGKRYHYSENWPGPQKIQILAEKSEGLFIYATTLCHFIDQKHVAEYRLQEILTAKSDLDGRGMKKIDDLYGNILAVEYQDIDNNSGDYGYSEDEKARVIRKFQRIVGTIVILFDSLDPLSLSGVIQAATEQIQERFSLGDKGEAEVVALVNDLGSVLSLDSARRIQLLHPSFRDFLLNNKRCKDTRFYIDSQKSHCAMATWCLNLLNRCLKKDICNLGFAGAHQEDVEKSQINKHLPPHVQYACRYWTKHLCQYSIGVGQLQDVYKFLEKHLLHWFEALSLMEALFDVVAMMELLLSKLKPADHNLSSLVYDAKRFILRHQSTIRKFPLQVYSSCLLFSPQESVVRKLHQTGIPTSIRVLPSTSRWGPLIQASTPLSSLRLLNCTSTSPNGVMSAFGSKDGVIQVWRGFTEELIWSRHSEPGEGNAVICLEFSPNSKLLASGSLDCTTKLWDSGKGNCVTELNESSTPIRSLTFSRDGTLLAFGSEDGTIWVWELSENRYQYVLTGNSKCISCLSFSSQGQLVSGFAGGFVKQWKYGTENCYATWESASVFLRSLNPLMLKYNLDTTEPDDKLQIYSVLVAPDGGLLASLVLEYSRLMLWDSRTKKCGLLSVERGRITCTSFSHDGSLLASGSALGIIKIWDLDAWGCHAVFNGHSTSVIYLSFLSETYLASCSARGEVGHWAFSAPEKGKPVPQYTPLSGFTGIRFSPNGKFLISLSVGDTIKLWDATTGGFLYRLQSSQIVNIDSNIAFSPNSKRLAVADQSTIKIWDITSKYAKVAFHIKGFAPEENLIRLSFLLNDSLLVTTRADGETVIELLDIFTGERIILPEFADARPSAFSPDGKILAVGTDNGAVRLWDIMGERDHGQLWGHQTKVESTDFSPDGKLLLSTCESRVILWDLETMQLHTTLDMDGGHFLQGIFSPDSKLLVASLCSPPQRSCENTKIKLWDTQTGKCYDEFGTGGSYFGIRSFSSNGKLLMGSSEELGMLTVTFWRFGIRMELISGNSTRASVPVIPTSDSCDYLGAQGLFVIPGGTSRDICYCFSGDAIAIGSGSGDIKIIRI
ncbi:hypothetical protein ABW19_dt0200605 [Dactylella cylindrospora]|nr:hypothetical protein ABW19_dt0200605 [Dactylella cylindrospora]